MRVLILSRTPQLVSVRRLAEETSLAGHQPVVLAPDSPDLKKTPADVVIPRFGTWQFEESLAALEHFERRRIPVLNSTNSLREARNKWISALALREDGIPVPAARLAAKKDLPREYPYVAKRLEGSKGAGVFLIRGAEDLLALPADPEWLVQEFVAEAHGRDRRLLVLDDRVVAAMERRAREGEFRSNLALGGEGFPHAPGARETELALAAARTLRLRMAGVDLIASRSGPLVLEVNGSPGIEGIEKASGVNVAAAVVASAIRLAEAR